MEHMADRWKGHLGGGSNRTAWQVTWHQAFIHTENVDNGGLAGWRPSVNEEEEEKHGGKRGVRKKEAKGRGRAQVSQGFPIFPISN